MTNPFDGTMYLVFRGGVPLGLCKFYGSALSLAGEFGATGIRRTMEGVWESEPNSDGVVTFIYRMGVRP